MKYIHPPDIDATKSRGWEPKMNEMKKETVQFASAIKETKQYQKYFEQKEKLKAYPELKEQIDEFRWRNYQLQTTCDQDELYFKLEEFELENEEFRANPFVSDFLAAELGFCRMMQQIYSDLAEKIEFE